MARTTVQLQPHDVCNCTIGLSRDKLRTTETGLNYHQSEAVVSTDLPSRAEVMEEFVDANRDQCYKAWKKLELQQWLKNHGVKVSGTKEELVARVENAKQAGVTPAAGSRIRVPRGTLYCANYLGYFLRSRYQSLLP